MRKQKSSASPPKASLISPPKTTESKRSHVIRLQRSCAPKAPLFAMPLHEGIRMLEEFGFRTQASAAVAPRLSVLTEFAQKPSKPLVHVTDFWSQRQQKEFLAKTGLKRAQDERERKERKEAFLGSKEKIEGVHINDQLYERIVAEDDPVEAVKAYASGPQGRLLKQLHNQVSFNSDRRRLFKYPPSRSNSEITLRIPCKRTHMNRFKELLTKCDDTMRRSVESRQ